jgi:hypothetical protein
MAKFTTLKRIVIEDFDKDNHDLINKLGFILNPIIDQLILSFNNRITFEENLNVEIRTLEAEVDEDGIPINDIVYVSNLHNRVQGMLVLRTFNISTKSNEVYDISDISDVSGGTTITTSSNHDFETGDRVFFDNTDCDPVIDGTHTVTVSTPTKFTIKQAITGAGTDGTASKFDSVFPQGYPFLTFSENQKTVTVKHVAGLQPNRKFQLVVLAIGTLN